MNLLESAKQGLKALEEMNPYPASKEQLRADAMTSLRQAIEQAEKQEPVRGAWILVPVTPTNEMTSAMADTLENPDNEKSSWDLAETMWKSMLLKVPAPPQREWVGLTNKEIRDIHWSKPMNEYSYARAIEAKLKEKQV